MSSTVECGAEAAHVVVNLPGPDLDPVVADALYVRFSGLAAQDPQTVIVVDLSAATFMDCAGLNPLVGAGARFDPRLLLRGVVLRCRDCSI